MKISAWDLICELKELTEEELKNSVVVIETNRPTPHRFGLSEYATFIEQYDKQIRIGNVKD